MKKVSVVVADKNRRASLEKLRELGVVHIEKRDVSSDALSQILDRKAKLEDVKGFLQAYLPKDKAKSAGSSAVDKTEDLADKVLALQEERKGLQEQLSAYEKERSRIERWGDFDPAGFKTLAEQGVRLIPYNLTVKAYGDLSSDQRFFVLSRDKFSVYGLAVDKEIAGETPFQLPESSFSALGALISGVRARLGGIESAFTDAALKINRLDDELSELSSQIEFESAGISMETTEEVPPELAVAWLSGYVPSEKAGVLKKAASENGWALLASDPGEDDKPPTLVKNNAFTRLAQPLFNMLGTIPGYREYDISLSYLLFFSFFFAMIFGDAGYGVVLLLLAALLGAKSKKAGGKTPDAVVLLVLLSMTTITWGVLTGAFFAIKSDHPFFQPKIPFLAEEQNIKWLCFIVGAVQISLAHIKNVKKALPSLTAVAQIGWLAMVVGLYFVVLNLVLSKDDFPVPPFALYLIGGGIVTYFIFAEQNGGSFGKNVGKSFANFLPTFLSAVSSFSDIISYIRLFAVGLAGAAIANSFNEMAGALPEGAARIVGGGFILLFGHGLNLVMNALSVVVHGLRLNLLEYAGHLGMEWSGYKYSPFALKPKKQD